MEENLTLQKVLSFISIFMGFGLLVWLVIHFVRKDNRTMPEKFLDKAKDLGSNIPGINK